MLTRFVLNSRISGDFYSFWKVGYGRWKVGTKLIPLKAVEGLFARDVIAQNDAIRRAIIRLRNRAEAFLTTGIPYLQLHPFTIWKKVNELQQKHFHVDDDSEADRIVPITKSYFRRDSTAW